jgi:hypothetical protein
LVDVSIVYPGGRPSLFDLLSGRIPRVCLRVHTRELPRDLLGRDYQDDPEFRARFQAWLNAQWQRKDEELEQMLQGPSAPG